jgi:hypothetical protein
MAAGDTLDQDDRLRFRMLMDQLFYGWQYTYFTTYPTEQPTAVKNLLITTLAQPGGMAYWERSKIRFDERFVQWVESCQREQGKKELS